MATDGGPLSARDCIHVTIFRMNAVLRQLGVQIRGKRFTKGSRYEMRVI
jgi:hypothetical protein